MDTEIGRLLGAVDLATTTVIFLGDNGTPGDVIGAPYQRAGPSSRSTRRGVRVPLLIAGAGVAAPGRREGGLVASVDLFPTILALAGISPPAGNRIDGVSLLPFLANTASVAGVRAFAYTETFPTSFDVGLRPRAPHAALQAGRARRGRAGVLRSRPGPARAGQSAGHGS